jgi:hypothetical protein
MDQLPEIRAFPEVEFKGWDGPGDQAGCVKGLQNGGFCKARDKRSLFVESLEQGLAGA